MIYFQKLVPAIFFASFLFLNDAADAEPLAVDCGDLLSLETSYGPFDYSDARDRKRLPVVEKHHFTRNVENLISGQSSRIEEDLDYTLHVFPNHLRALDAMGRLWLRDGNRTRGFPAECYFERAIVFRNRDSGVHLVYGIYLYKTKRWGDAAERLKWAIELSPDSAEAHYSMGLTLLEMGDYEEAAHHAKEARRLGYPLDGLINLLKRAGHWQEDSKSGVTQE